MLDEPGLAQRVAEGGGADRAAAGRLDGEAGDATGADEGGERSGGRSEPARIVVEHEGLSPTALEVQHGVTVVDDGE